VLVSTHFVKEDANFILASENNYSDSEFPYFMKKSVMNLKIQHILCINHIYLYRLNEKCISYSYVDLFLYNSNILLIYDAFYILCM
jgi:hypothetical protein